MSWKVARAKQRFSEVLRLAADEPQLIHNRERLVGAVIGPRDAEAFLSWRQHRAASVAQALEEVRRICQEDGFALEVPPRVDRENALLGPTHARRHQRRQ